MQNPPIGGCTLLLQELRGPVNQPTTNMSGESTKIQEEKRQLHQEV